MEVGDAGSSVGVPVRLQGLSVGFFVTVPARGAQDVELVLGHSPGDFAEDPDALLRFKTAEENNLVFLGRVVEGVGVVNLDGVGKIFDRDGVGNAVKVTGNLRKGSALRNKFHAVAGDRLLHPGRDVFEVGPIEVADDVDGPQAR